MTHLQRQIRRWKAVRNLWIWQRDDRAAKGLDTADAQREIDMVEEMLRKLEEKNVH